MFAPKHRSVRELDAALTMIENRFRDVSAGSTTARSNAADALSATARVATTVAELRGHVTARLDAIDERIADLIGPPVALAYEDTASDPDLTIDDGDAEDQPAAAEPLAPAEPSSAEQNEAA